MELNRLTNPQEVERLANRIEAAHIGHELVLSDNIDECWKNTDDYKSWQNHPVKVVGATIVFCLSGAITYRINLSDHTVKAGEALIILPGSIMQTATFSTDLKIATVSFATFYYESIVDITPQMRENPIVSLPETDFEECVAIYKRLKPRVSESSDDTTKSIAKGYIRVVCNILFSHWIRNTPQEDLGSSRPKELYGKFLSKVQAEYRVHHSVKHYADSLCVTPKYLSSVVKRESGRNASEFIDEMIVFEAKALLSDERHSVQQVAEMMHFPNPSFFAKFFRQRCGVSPSSFKRKR